MNYTLCQEYVKLCDALRAGLPIIRVKIESSSAHESIFRLDWAGVLGIMTHITDTA